MHSPIDELNILLAAQVAGAFDELHHIAYAQLRSDLTVARTSPNFSSVLSEPTGAILNRHISELIWELFGSEAELQAVLNGEANTYVLEHVNRLVAEQRPIYFDFYVRRLQESALGAGLLLIAEDVTRHAELEQALLQERNELRLVKTELTGANDSLRQLDRMKSLFLSIAAHDLASPLTSIQGYTYLLLSTGMTNLTDQQKAYIQVVTSQAQNMQRLLKDFLDLDQLESGQMRLNLAEYELNDMVADVFQALALEADKRQLSYDLYLTKTAVRMQMDLDRVRRVCYNLIHNAIKYTEPGGNVTVSTRLDAGRVMITIADTGTGMTPAQQENLFTPYYRTEDARGGKAMGTGLGLFIVKMLVDAHGGHIGVDSTYGKGSTFTVSLPLSQPVLAGDEASVQE